MNPLDPYWEIRSVIIHFPSPAIITIFQAEIMAKQGKLQTTYGQSHTYRTFV